jgi:hypothetical protein
MRTAFLLSSLVVMLVLAGCTEPAAPPSPRAEPAPAVETTEMVDWSATVTGLCAVASGGNVCMSGPVVSGGGNADSEPTYVHDADNRSLAAGTLALEWEANTLATENLRFVAMAYTGCPDDCEANRTLGSASGASPLVIQLMPFDADGLEIVVHVEKVDFAPGMQATPGQPVHLSGELVFSGPAGDVPATGGSAVPA